MRRVDSCASNTNRQLPRLDSGKHEVDFFLSFFVAMSNLNFTDFGVFQNVSVEDGVNTIFYCLCQYDP